MRDITTFKAFSLVEPSEGVFVLFTFNKSDVMLLIHRIEVANKRHAKFATANIFASN